MKLTNMKMSAEEADEYGESTLAEAPEYPYGLRLSLDDDALDKLGLGEKLPKVGETLTVLAKVDVVHVHVSQDQEGEPESSVQLQITDMSVEKPYEESNAESALYGSEED